MGQPTSDRISELWGPVRSAAETTFQQAVRQLKAFRSQTPAASERRWKSLPDLDPAALHRLGDMIEGMNDTEREEMLRTVGHTVLAFESTKDVDFMVQLARQVQITMALRNSDEYVKALRDEPQEAAPTANAVPIGELLSKLG